MRVKVKNKDWSVCFVVSLSQHVTSLAYFLQKEWLVVAEVKVIRRAMCDKLFGFFQKIHRFVNLCFDVLPIYMPSFFDPLNSLKSLLFEILFLLLQDIDCIGPDLCKEDVAMTRKEIKDFRWTWHFVQWIIFDDDEFRNTQGITPVVTFQNHAANAFYVECEKVDFFLKVSLAYLLHA